MALDPLTRDWIEKVEDDFRVMRRERKVEDDPSFDAACFHAQQCVEKYLKAVLCEGKIPFPKSHDLAGLLYRMEEPLRELVAIETELNALTDRAVNTRYPGCSADATAAEAAAATAERAREICRRSLGLEVS